jgi:antitoxin CptB
MTEDQHTRRKRLRYRSRYRGNKEMDLILGAFAERYLDGLSDDELDQYERLLEADDLSVYNWIAGRAPLPPEFDTAVMARLRQLKIPTGFN